MSPRPPAAVVLLRVPASSEEIQVFVAPAPGQGSPTNIDRLLGMVSNWCDAYVGGSPLSFINYNGLMTCSGPQLVEAAAASLSAEDDSISQAMAGLRSLTRLWSTTRERAAREALLGALVVVLQMIPLDESVRFLKWVDSALPRRSDELRAELKRIAELPTRTKDVVPPSGAKV